MFSVSELSLQKSLVSILTATPVLEAALVMGQRLKRLRRWGFFPLPGLWRGIPMVSLEKGVLCGCVNQAIPFS